jgi:predicted TIM-barrel enzyme
MPEERHFDRSAIIQRLRDTRGRGLPIVATSAGIGLVAKSAEAAGVDFITVQVTGLSRHLGVPTTTTLGNATRLTMETYPEIDNVVERTPIVGGIEATDGTRRRISRTIQQYVDLGFDGISNFPTVGAMPIWADIRSSVGEGIDREFELIRLAREAGIFTVAHAYTAAHASALAGSGADVVVARCGPTVGGYVGPPRDSAKPAAAAELVQSIATAVRAANAEAFVIAHGGPFATPEDTGYLYAQTDAQGILGESAIERLPIEAYVSNQVAAFKNQSIKSRGTSDRG